MYMSICWYKQTISNKHARYVHKNENNCMADLVTELTNLCVFDVILTVHRR